MQGCFGYLGVIAFVVVGVVVLLFGWIIDMIQSYWPWLVGIVVIIVAIGIMGNKGNQNGE